MDTHHATSHDLLHDEAYAPLPYSPLPDHPVPAGAPALGQRRPLKVFAVTLASLMFLVSLVALVIHQSPQTPVTVDNDGPSMEREGRGVAQGVSEKSFLGFSGRRLSYNWTTAMFAWQRTAFHFQPEKNWMNGRSPSFFSLSFSNYTSHIFQMVRIFSILFFFPFFFYIILEMHFVKCFL